MPGLMWILMKIMQPMDQRFGMEDSFESIRISLTEAELSAFLHGVHFVLLFRNGHIVLKQLLLQQVKFILVPIVVNYKSSSRNMFLGILETFF